MRLCVLLFALAALRAQNDPAVLTGQNTVVAFISSNCPVSNAFNDRLSALYRTYANRGVRFYVVNSNVNETDAEVAAHAASAGFPFPVHRDPGNALANRLHASATPETFLLDASGVVRYHGAIEDSQNPARTRVRGLRDAIEAVLAGKPVPVPETKAFGCTIKRPRRTTGTS